MEELLKIQSELNVPKNQMNSFGNYKYRSAEDILEAVKPLLKKYKCILTISDEVVNIGERYYVRANAIISKMGATKEEASGVMVTAFARESESKKGMDEAQITGSASSYARKYALNGLFAIDDTKDADTQDNTSTEATVKMVTRKQGKYLQDLGYEGKIKGMTFDEASKEIKLLAE